MNPIRSTVRKEEGTPVLSDLFTGVPGVAHAFIFGSWAARHAGQSGGVPADLDVLVVGHADLDDLDEIAGQARTRLGIEVNVQRVSVESWESSDPDPFLAHVKSQPLVALDIDREEP